MTRYTDYAAAPGHTGSRLTCPLCSHDLIRVARRPVDRLLSLVAPQCRYRCRQHDCQWEGALRVGSPALAKPPAR